MANKNVYNFHKINSSMCIPLIDVEMAIIS